MQETSLSEQIKKRGYKIPKIIIPSQELLSIKEVIDKEKHTNVKLNKRNLKYILDRTHSFLDSHFCLYDVPFYSENRLGPIKIEKYGTIHPYGLPITKVKGEDTFYGCLREVIDYKDDKIINYSYRGIELSKNLTELSSLSYTHEIVHSELNHVKGIVKEYSNIEFLSIFLETLQAYETSQDLLIIHDQERLLELSGIIKELKEYHSTTDSQIKDVLIEGSSYAESTLKAYALFIKYYNSSSQVKKEILSSIQKIFNYELSVEEFLMKYDITFSESLDSITIKSYLKRR